MPGNQYGDKLNPDQKQIAYKQYCDHIAQGYSKEAWYYEDPNDKELSITFETIEAYIQKEPEAFRASQLKKAYSASRKFFESTGLDMMTGANTKGNPATFQIFMRNKFGWDKDAAPKDQNKCIFNDELKKLKEDE